MVIRHKLLANNKTLWPFRANLSKTFDRRLSKTFDRRMFYGPVYRFATTWGIGSSYLLVAMGVFKPNGTISRHSNGSRELPSLILVEL